jgi:hypothetical protein
MKNFVIFTFFRILKGDCKSVRDVPRGVCLEPDFSLSVLRLSTRLHFYARSQKCEKPVFASSCPSFRSFARPYGTTRLLLDGFSRKLIFERFSKICRESSGFIRI